MACVPIRTLFIHMGSRSARRSRRRYQQLLRDGIDVDVDVEKKAAAAARPRRRRCRASKSSNGATQVLPLGFRVSSSKKSSRRLTTTWRGRLMSSLLLLPRRLWRHVYAVVLTGIMAALEAGVLHPTIVYSSQWGLPVLSHPPSTNISTISGSARRTTKSSSTSPASATTTAAALFTTV